MAPTKFSLATFKRSTSDNQIGNAARPELSLGASIAIAIGVAFVCSLALVVGFNYYRHKLQQRIYKSVRARTRDTMKCETASRGAIPILRTKLSRMFFPKRRMPRENPRELGGHAPKQFADTPEPDKELDDLRRESAAELEGEGSVFEAEQLRRMSPSLFEETNRQLEYPGPVPPHSYSPGIKSEQDVSAIGHYRPDDVSSAPLPLRSLELSGLRLTLPSTTEAPPAAWHRKRTGPPPPLIIASPAHSRSPSDAYSTYNATQSPYEYCSFNLPPLPSSTPLAHEIASNLVHYDSPLLHSSKSTRSKGPLRPATSPQFAIGSAPSMSRSDSWGAHAESLSLPPPTPTYQRTQTKRIPDDTTNFECLGPLPANIPLPSPQHFQTEQRARSPHSPGKIPVHEEEHGLDSPFSFRTASSSRGSSPMYAQAPLLHGSNPFLSHSRSKVPVYAQDPLLHDSSPFRPHHSPVNPTFTAALADFEAKRERRQSTDSLGSNFTVEEEARIQAQIVRNLEMLGRERVVVGDDIVHIPQISGRRYSWEGE